MFVAAFGQGIEHLVRSALAADHLFDVRQRVAVVGEELQVVTRFHPRPPSAARIAPGVFGGTAFQRTEHQGQRDDLSAAIPAAAEVRDGLAHRIKVVDAKQFGGDVVGVVFVEQTLIAGPALRDEPRCPLGRALAGHERAHELAPHIHRGCSQLC